MHHPRKIEDIVNALKRGKEANRGCTLLIGSGCSVKAGIPTGSGFVEVIQEEYPEEYARATEKTYPSCIAQLKPGERRDLITRYVVKAKINWAHICIAQLMKEGYISRVLTTNFDPLVIRACALLGFFPAVYDSATSQDFKSTVIPKEAVFYLHGQHTGFVLLNTAEECSDHSERLVPVFEEARQGRLWLVVGYSGESDPVFEHLTKVKQFEYGLYWICRRDEPPKHIRDGLITKDRYAYYIGNWDADDFFVRLTQDIGCFPEFVSKPFSHLDGLLSSIAPYTMPGQKTEKDVTERARKYLRKVIEEYEIGEKALDTDISEKTDQFYPQLAFEFLMAGEYENVIALRPIYEKGDAPELAESISWAYIMQGNKLVALASTKDGVESDALFEQAYEKYMSAVDIKLDSHVALFNWGTALSHHAIAKDGEEADNLFAQAYEKFKTATNIKPDYHEALNNWGTALLHHVIAKDGEEADNLFAQAYEKFKTATNIKPDFHEALNNWGNAILEQAKTKDGEEADKLFAQVYEKYKTAIDIKPDYHPAFGNWGGALLEQYKMKRGGEADKLLDEAKEMCIRVETILPGFGAYNLACIHALQGQEHECRKWLEKGRDAGYLPTKAYIEKDSDFDNVKESDWFKEFLQSI